MLSSWLLDYWLHVFVWLNSFYESKCSGSKAAWDGSDNEDADSDDDRAAARERTSMIKAEFEKRKKVCSSIELVPHLYLLHLFVPFFGPFFSLLYWLIVINHDELLTCV